LHINLLKLERYYVKG